MKPQKEMPWDQDPGDRPSLHSRIFRTAGQRRLLQQRRTPRLPLGALQVVVGLLQLSHVLVQLLLDGPSLTQVIFQHRHLLVALCVLLL